METIVWLGENGLLDEPAAQTDVSLDSTPNNASGVQDRTENGQLWERL